MSEQCWWYYIPIFSAEWVASLHFSLIPTHMQDTTPEIDAGRWMIERSQTKRAARHQRLNMQRARQKQKPITDILYRL